VPQAQAKRRQGEGQSHAALQAQAKRLDSEGQGEDTNASLSPTQARIL